MKISTERKKQTELLAQISASAEELQQIKQKVLRKLATKVKVSGFREGKAPLEVVEKNIDQQTLQSEFLDTAINELYIGALREERIRPVGNPKVEVTKFVPFSVLDIKLELPVVGEITLPDYKKLTAKKTVKKITKKDIEGVIDNLKKRVAEKKEVVRAAKIGDEAWIDFSGKDKNGKPVEGADGKDYPLALGSGTFIPGFEDNVVGMKPGEQKDFTVTFPKDYGAKNLQNAKVTFMVTLNKVQEVDEPKADDAFAAKVGPFKNLEELTTDINKQLGEEAERQAEREYEAALLDEVANKARVEIPDILIEEQEQLVLNEVRQNAVQRGMTFEQFLEQQDLSEADFIKNEVKPEAMRRIKAGLVLSEIGDIENITVTPEELEARLQVMKGQYPDKKMQEQLDEPENRREINARLRSEKVIAFLKK